MASWKILKLGDLLTESKIESTRPDPRKRIRVKLNLGGIEQRPELIDKEGATRYYIRKAGQFIYGKQNLHKGAFGIVPQELDNYESSSDIPAFDVNEICYPEWVFYFFKQNNFYLKLESLAQGVGSKRISTKQIYELKIALPDKDEQKKILESIYELEHQAEKLNSQIEYQLSLINKLKKVVVNEGLLGKLTNEWRQRQVTEASTSLLKKIRLQKAKLISEKKIPKEKKSFTLNTSELTYDLPDDWIWCRFGEIILDIEAGKSPLCDPQPAGLDEWGVIKISAVSWGKFLEYENKTLPLNFTPFRDKEIKAGDFILSRANTAELIARSVIVQNDVRSQLLLNDKTLRIKFTELCDLNYINYFNNSSIARSYYLTVASGTSDSMKNISREHLKLQLFPLAPSFEQKEISRILDALLNKYSQLEEQISFSKKNIWHYVNLTIGEYLQSTKELNLISNNKTLIRKEYNKQPEANIFNKLEIKRLNMELEDLLNENGKMSAINLWKMSKFQDNIDAFYAELKLKIEINATIKESEEKGFLELNK